MIKHTFDKSGSFRVRFCNASEKRMISLPNTCLAVVYDFVGIYTQVCMLFIDLQVIFACFPWWLLLIAAWPLFDRWRKKIAVYGPKSVTAGEFDADDYTVVTRNADGTIDEISLSVEMLRMLWYNIFEKR